MFDLVEKVTGDEARERLHAVSHRVEPMVLAEERTLPVPETLRSLFPSGALRRGTAVGVDGVGARSVALSLAAEVTAAGGWTVVVGMTGLNLAVAAELGVALERLAVVAAPEPRSWPDVVGALLGAVDLILIAPEHRVKAGDVRRLTSRARERGSVLMQVGPKVSAWPEQHDLHLHVAASMWEGLGVGHGCLRQRQIEIVTSGRRDAARPRRLEVCLPDPTGALTSVQPAWAGSEYQDTPAAGSGDGVVVPLRQVS